MTDRPLPLLSFGDWATVPNCYLCSRNTTTFLSCFILAYHPNQHCDSAVEGFTKCYTLNQNILYKWPTTTATSMGELHHRSSYRGLSHRSSKQVRSSPTFTSIHPLTTLPVKNPIPKTTWHSILTTFPLNLTQTSLHFSHGTPCASDTPLRICSHPMPLPHLELQNVLSANATRSLPSHCTQKNTIHKLTWHRRWGFDEIHVSAPPGAVRRLGCTHPSADDAPKCPERKFPTRLAQRHASWLCQFPRSSFEPVALSEPKHRSRSSPPVQVGFRIATTLAPLAHRHQCDEDTKTMLHDTAKPPMQTFALRIMEQHNPRHCLSASVSLPQSGVCAPDPSLKPMHALFHPLLQQSIPTLC